MPTDTPRILFLFPHPDDEAFVTGGTIAKYAGSGAADVFLYTLTRGESSRNAAYLGISPDEIGRRRIEEVEHAARILGVARLLQGAYPDGGLRDLDPRVLEQDFERVILELHPHVLVTFDVQGGSVHPDHIVAHHTAKRVFVTLRGRDTSLQRLCFAGLPSERIAHWPRRVFGIPQHRVDAVIDVSAWRTTEEAAILAHASVERDVREHNYDGWMFWPEEHYSFFQERYSPPVDDLLHGLTF